MMDANGFSNQALRNEHLLRLLKQFELEAHNSLRGPAGLVGSSANTGGSSQHTSNLIENRLNKLQSGNGLQPEMETSMISQVARSKLAESYCQDSRRGDHVEERVLAVDRSASKQQEALLKEIIALKGAIPIQQSPALTSRDRTPSASERKETLLEGEIITCFVIGGEKRLCLPQVLNTVLKNVPMVEINQACSELNIHCGHCTPEQLLALKIAGVVSATTASCALITKTDAERLSDYLLRQRRIGVTLGSVSMGQNDKKNWTSERQRLPATTMGVYSESERRTVMSELMSNRIRRLEDTEGLSVVHFCFGYCGGHYFPCLYASPSAECIQCDECRQFFAPDRFVVHSHGNQERRTCHWGFDSANWRSYLHLTEEDECEENKKILDDMKLRFDITGLTKKQFEQEREESRNRLMLKRKLESDDVQQYEKRFLLDRGAAEPSTMPKEKDQKLSTQPASSASAISNASLLTQTGLPFFMCDPLLLATYCQPAFQSLLSNCFAAAIRAAAASQTPAGQLPSLDKLTGQQTSKTSEHSRADIDWTSQQQLRTDAGQSKETERDGRLDEATAIAALKLLQLHNVRNVGFGEAGGEKKECGQYGMESEKIVANDRLSNSSSVKSDGQQQPSTSTISKEPFKKQLLHLFTAEQQRRQEEKRLSCEIINSEKSYEDTGTPETQVADELSISSSDNEGHNGDVTLDDLLGQYITDTTGLKMVRSKIAENQRFLEQKLDAVSAENRLLFAECQQLRMKLLEHRQHREDSEKSTAVLHTKRYVL